MASALGESGSRPSWFPLQPPAPPTCEAGRPWSARRSGVGRPGLPL